MNFGVKLSCRRHDKWLLFINDFPFAPSILLPLVPGDFLVFSHDLLFSDSLSLCLKYNENCLLISRLSAALTTVGCVWHPMHSSATS